MREYTERALGSQGLSIVFVFGFSKSFWLIEEKFSFLQKCNEKKRKRRKTQKYNEKKKIFWVCVLVQDKLGSQFI